MHQRNGRDLEVHRSESEFRTAEFVVQVGRGFINGNDLEVRINISSGPLIA